MNDFRALLTRKLWRRQEGFQHEPLGLSQNEIRLLKFRNTKWNAPVELELQHFPFLRAPSYIALSYCWGERLQPYTVQINGKIATINPNLHRALAALRHHCRYASEVYFWIDALCIDQSNEEEKGSQIPRMASLFHRASRVVAYLGQPDHNSAIVLGYLRQRQGAIGDARATGTVLAKELLSTAVSTFFERAWFSRIWIVQEFSVASTLLFMVGTETFDEQDLNRLVEFYDRTNGKDYLALLPAIGLLLLLREHRITHTPLSLLDILRMTSWNTNVQGPITFQSTDLRDQIYALLGLVYDHMTWVSELSYAKTFSVNDLFVEMTRTAMRSTSSLNVILLEGETDKPRGMSDFKSKNSDGYDRKTRPSWCPDYVNLGRSMRNNEIVESLYTTSAVFDRLHVLDCRGMDSMTRLDSWFEITPDSRILKTKAVMLGTICSRREWLASRSGQSCITRLQVQPQVLNSLLIIYGDEVFDSSNHELLGGQGHVYDHCIARDLNSLDCCLQGRYVVCRDHKETVEEIIFNLGNNNGDDVLGFLLQSMKTPNDESQARQLPEIEERRKAVHFAIHSTYENYCSFDRKLVGLDLDTQLLDDTGLLSDTLGVAWTPVDSKPGDKIFVIAGCSFPVVLRAQVNASSASQPQTWRKIGAACMPPLLAGIFRNKAYLAGLDQYIHIE